MCTSLHDPPHHPHHPPHPRHSPPPTADAELVELARDEVQTLTKQLESLEEQLKVLLLPRDPLDDKNIMLEVCPVVVVVLLPLLFYCRCRHRRSWYCCCSSLLVAVHAK